MPTEIFSILEIYEVDLYGIIRNSIWKVKILYESFMRLDMSF